MICLDFAPGERAGVFVVSFDYALSTPAAKLPGEPLHIERGCFFERWAAFAAISI
jgi:hypothetical protein